MIISSILKPPLRAGIIVFLIASLFGSYVVLQNYGHHKKAERSVVEALLARHGLQLEQQIRQGMAVNELLGVLIRSDISQLDNFENIAQNLLRVSPSLSHFSLAPNGLIDRVFPLSGNEASIGFNLLEDPDQGPDAVKAKELNQQYISGPLNLVQGGKAFILRYPIFLKAEPNHNQDGFWGFSSIILRLETLFEVAGFELLSEEGINFHFYHQPSDALPEVIFASQGALLKEVVKHDLQLPDGKWFLVASPENRWVDTTHIALEAVPVFFVCLLIGIFAAQLTRIRTMNIGLEKIVSERTKELQVAAIAFQSQNGILVTDKNYQIVRVNQAFEKITGYYEPEVIGKNPSLLNSGRHDKFFYQKMYFELRDKGSWQGEIWNRRKSGEIYPEYLTITAIRNESGELTNYVASLVDMTELKETQEKVHQLKYFDSLTNLPNRNQLKEILSEIMDDYDDQTLGFMLFLDLDHFKQLNDALGQSAGDKLLLELTQRLNTLLPSTAILTRLGSDEFVILQQLTGCDTNQAASAAEELAESIISSTSEPFILVNQSHRITASIGVTLIRSLVDPDELLKQAELAMFQAKSKGRNWA